MASEPLLFVTTPGADPSAELEELAVSVVGKRAFSAMAMGQGQTNQALAALRDAAKLGHWLLLKNLHLVTPWLYTLEKELTNLRPHDAFRLFLTSGMETRQLGPGSHFIYLCSKSSFVPMYLYTSIFQLCFAFRATRQFSPDAASKQQKHYV